jgi:hypothetical protein
VRPRPGRCRPSFPEGDGTARHCPANKNTRDIASIFIYKCTTLGATVHDSERARLDLLPCQERRRELAAATPRRPSRAADRLTAPGLAAGGGIEGPAARSRCSLNPRRVDGRSVRPWFPAAPGPQGNLSFHEAGAHGRRGDTQRLADHRGALAACVPFNDHSCVEVRRARTRPPRRAEFNIGLSKPTPRGLVGHPVLDCDSGHAAERTVRASEISFGWSRY